MKIIKDFKEKKCENWFCVLTQYLFFNNIAKLLILMSLSLFGAIGIGIIESDSLIFAIPFYIGLGGLALYGILYALFAWIINPIINSIFK